MANTSESIEELEMDYENDFAIYCFPDTKEEVFRYHVPTLEGFKMTVKELIEELKQYPEDEEIWYECLWPITAVAEHKVREYGSDPFWVVSIGQDV